MSTFFVSKEGSDSNNGLGPDASHASNKPFLTIGKLIAASGALASGETAYIGPGVYRETVSVGITSPTVETQILGDPLNAQGFKTSGGVLVAPGDVVWTAYTTNDATAPAAATTLNLNQRDFLTFQYVTIIGGNANPSCVNAGTANCVNIVLRDCKIIVGNVSNPAITYVGSADVAANWTIDRCKIFSFGGNAISITLPTSASADYDANFLIQNSELFAPGSSAISVTTSGAAAFKGGGVDVVNCVINCRLSGFTTATANVATTIPCTCNNTIIIAGNGAALNANTAGQITENYCRIISASTRTNVTAGANSIADMSHAPLFDLGFAAQLGFIPKPYWGPSASSPILAFGSTGAPSVDALNRPRPAGGASTSNAVGAYERHDTAVQDTAGPDASTSAAALTGPADQDFFIPVDASSTTITVRVKWDATHADTNKPQAILLANGAIGVATETKTATGSAGGGYETLTFSAFTPSAKGIVTIRCISRSAAGGGIAEFDTFTGGAQGSQSLDYWRAGEVLQAAVATAAGGSGGLIGGGSLTGGVQ